MQKERFLLKKKGGGAENTDWKFKVHHTLAKSIHTPTLWLSCNGGMTEKWVAGTKQKKPPKTRTETREADNSKWKHEGQTSPS